MVAPHCTSISSPASTIRWAMPGEGACSRLRSELHTCSSSEESRPIIRVLRISGYRCSQIKSPGPNSPHSHSQSLHNYRDCACLGSGPAAINRSPEHPRTTRASSEYRSDLKISNSSGSVNFAFSFHQIITSSSLTFSNSRCETPFPVPER